MRVLIISCEPFLTGFLSVMNKDLDVAAIIMPNDKLINGFLIIYLFLILIKFKCN